MSSTSATDALANPSRLQPFAQKPKSSTSGTAEPGQQLLQVVIETPRGSRNKYSFDTEQRIFHLKSALPAGMVFPYDFGFVPRTIGGDGDPLDALVLMEQPAFPGCALLVRILGALESEQTERGKTERNDRLVCVAETSQLYANLHAIDDLPSQALNEVEEFFANYHRLQGKQSRTVARSGVERAHELIAEARKRYSAKHSG